MEGEPRNIREAKPTARQLDALTAVVAAIEKLSTDERSNVLEAARVLCVPPPEYPLPFGGTLDGRGMIVPGGPLRGPGAPR